jgi:hypothetical protein
MKQNTLFLKWKIKHASIFIERNDLDLIPLSEAPARTLEDDEFHKSSLISLSNFEAYLERAKQLDLFNEQHSVSCFEIMWHLNDPAFIWRHFREVKRSRGRKEFYLKTSPKIATMI